MEKAVNVVRRLQVALFGVTMFNRYVRRFQYSTTKWRIERESTKQCEGEPNPFARRRRLRLFPLE